MSTDISNPSLFFDNHFNDYVLHEDAPILSDSEAAQFSTVIVTAARSLDKQLNNNPLLWTLNAVFTSKYLPTELIIVDTTESTIVDYTHDVFSFIQKQFPSIKMTYVKKVGIGVAKGRNLGLSYTQNELVHLLDDDCIIHPEATLIATKILSFLRLKKPDIFNRLAILDLPQNKRAAVPTKIINGTDISRFDLENFNFTGGMSSTFPMEFVSVSPEAILQKPLLLDNFQGGHLFVIKKRLLESGGYPEYNGPITYAEETGLAFKLKELGAAIVYYPFFNLQAVHLSYGNNNPPFTFAGNTHGFSMANPTIQEMVTLSVMPKVDTGARVESSIYFYTKIRNFTLVLREFFASYEKKWTEYVEQAFVKENEINFQDGKKSVENELLRKQIFDLATSDAQTGGTKTKIQLRDIFPHI